MQRAQKYKLYLLGVIKLQSRQTFKIAGIYYVVHIIFKTFQSSPEDSEPGIPSTRSSRRGLRASATRTNSNPPTLAINSEEFHKRATLSPLAHLLFYCWQFTTIGEAPFLLISLNESFKKYFIFLAAVTLVSI